MHIITVTTNTASGGDFTSISANEGPDGWNKYTDPINPWELEEEYEDVPL